MTWIVAGCGLVALAACSPGDLPSGPSPVDAKNMVWDVENASGRTINLRFFDRTTGAWWPGGGSSWSLPGGRRDIYRLSCSDDSKVCLGAAAANNSNIYWGVGLDGTSGCEDCCHTCGNGNPKAIRLD